MKDLYARCVESRRNRFPFITFHLPAFKKELHFLPPVKVKNGMLFNSETGQFGNLPFSNHAASEPGGIGAANDAELMVLQNEHKLLHKRSSLKEVTKKRREQCPASLQTAVLSMVLFV